MKIVHFIKVILMYMDNLLLTITLGINTFYLLEYGKLNMTV